VWRRGNPATSTLTLMTGQTGYLVKVTNTVTTLNVPMTFTPLPPRTVWVRNGANLLGFPTKQTGSTYPTFASYFNSFAPALTGKIFKYIGGELSTTNPLQLFSTSSERVDRNQAYWFETQAVENFHGPLEITVSDPAGVDFGRLGSLITVSIRNRTTVAQTVTLTPSSSAAPPSGQEAFSGPVPLTRLTFNPALPGYVETPLAGATPVSIAAGATVQIQIGVNRASMSGTNNQLYASLLRVTDAANAMDVYLPVRARVAGMAGLWVGDALVGNVESKAPGFTGPAATAREYPLRFIVHVDAAGTARILSQVFIGKLAPAPHGVGLCTFESALKQDEKTGARRIVAAHLPLDRAEPAGGSFGLGGTLTHTVSLPFNDATNPFVHQYHPDHDNKDARFQPVGAGVESFTVGRALTFTFSSSPPPGTSSIGWGSTVVAGTYAETLTGLHKQSVTVSGTFELRRVSEIGTITTPN
jgi:hypothetical protein